jgi:hypothetical protein
VTIWNATKLALPASFVVILVPTSGGCDDPLGGCRSTSMQAADRIITAWCERWIACDTTRGTVAECKGQRMGTSAVSDETGCASDCSRDDFCSRSSCKDERIAECADLARAMGCSEMMRGAVVSYPDFCDSCFR